MKNSLEIEAKTLLPVSVYQKLITAFPVKERFWQTNYYFDTSDHLLHKQSAGLRIRCYHDSAEQTLKVKDQTPVQRKYHEVIEITDKLSVSEARKLLDAARKGEKVPFEGKVKAYLDQNFGTPFIPKLSIFASSKTDRLLSDGPDHCELTLDATTYEDHFTDYELEIENPNPDQIKKTLTQLQKAYHFNSTKQNTNQNKVARAEKHAS